MFQLADARDQTKHGFHQHSLTPGFVSTKLEIACRLARFLEAKVTENNRLLIELVSHWTKPLVVDIGRVPVPGHHLAPVVDQPTQLNADNPAAVALALLAHLLRATSLPHRMNEFNPVGVDDSEESGVGQEALTPLLMCSQRSRDARAVRQFNKQRPEVAFQPAIKRAKEATFERIQQSYRHQFTRIQVRIRAFGKFAHAIIYQTEQRNDKVFGGHGSFLFMV